MLVQGGAGGMGPVTIQLAHKAGARVITTVSSKERAERLIAAGLDHAVDHREIEVVREVM